MTNRIISAIEAAKMEADGLGSFKLVGKTIIFRTSDGMECQWAGSSKGHATQMLRLFRASLKYPAAIAAIGAMGS